MKKTLFVLGLAVLTLGCKQESKVDYAILEGNISNFKGKELAINDLSGAFRGKITLKEDGSFIDTLKSASGTYMLSDGKNKMQFYLEEGDRLKVNYDAANSATLTFDGSAAATATYYEAKKKKSQDLEVGAQNIYTLDEEAFLATLNEVKKAHQDLLTASTSLSASFKNLEEANINFEYLNQVNNYELYHGYYTNNREFKASEKIHALLKEVNMGDPEAYRFSTAYKSLLTGTYNQKAAELVEKDSLPQPLALLKAISENPNDGIKNNLLFENAKVYLSYSEEPKTYFEFYMANATDEEQKAEIRKDYEKLMTLSEGNPSPEFTDYENYAGGTTSLENLKGKYVYIDVWATWCGPCKREIPFLKTLEADYHNRNIEFVSISIDSREDHDKWQKMVADLELGGVQLFADNDWESQFIQDYMIKGIPRFILLDPQGNIVNSNAPRPSSDEIRNVFETLEM
ncbi:TlpA family protein disulfide reductase [Robertkochia flava]|uniref:TlpA family protein disulfide reductase n=1 Tax=Robertkochia flava TaxID=3447986 RepID=UPI001CCABD44|nr:TlpA disulfide reductase family protein [Robertkochia marina]